MEALIMRGVPMRAAHEAVGKLVRECEERGWKLAELPEERYDMLVPGGGSQLRATLGVANAVAAYKSVGSSAPVEVTNQLSEWKQRLGM
jgi:argininosuccinate lyase